MLSDELTLKQSVAGTACYRQEPAVAPGSNVETFVALKFAIDNWRWAGVPFYLRTALRSLSQHTRERHALE